MYGELCKAVKCDMWYYKPGFYLARCVVQFVYIFLIPYIYHVDRGIGVNWESFWLSLFYVLFLISLAVLGLNVPRVWGCVLIG